jgi:hypothetical protein
MKFLFCLHKFHDRCLRKFIANKEAFKCPECGVDMMQTWDAHRKAYGC